MTDANEVSSTFFGLPLESYIGSLASEKHPDYLQKLNFLEEILDSNSYREKDEYFPRTERYTHWVIYSPGKDEIVGLFLDSTGSVQANRALDRSEKLFKNIFANIPAGVEIYDKDGYLIDLNNKYLEIFFDLDEWFKMYSQKNFLCILNTLSWQHGCNAKWSSDIVGDS